MCEGCEEAGGVSRRNFMALAGAALVLPQASGEAGLQMPIRTALKVQPLLIYATPRRRESASWRDWGGIQTEQDAAAEKERIAAELSRMKAAADFPLEVKPVLAAKTVEEAAKIGGGEHDLTITYAAGGVRLLEAATPQSKWNIVFLRHRSGPVYLWYEVVHSRYLRKTVDEFGQPGMTVHDVVVDNHDEVLWRLRALAGLKNTVGKKIIAVGGPSGWGAGGRDAPEKGKRIFQLDIHIVPYPELGERIKRARKNDALVRRAKDGAAKYLGQKNVTLKTNRKFVENSFVLTEVFHELLDEAKTDAITINSCMGTIMPMAETSACLPLSLLNDKGYMAFCESDFVVIPSGILLHYISGKPVFLNDPTWPHDNMVTIAHCTAPRKLNGTRDEPVTLLTHFESDYGASPKVEMAKGEKVTNIIPDFHAKRWVGFEGEVLGNPFLAICRSQTDVSIHGDNTKLLEEMGGFHWMTSYGSYLKETGYALKKVGVDWLALA